MKRYVSIVSHCFGFVLNPLDKSPVYPYLSKNLYNP
jgi:hypothetical protein